MKHIKLFEDYSTDSVDNSKKPEIKPVTPNRVMVCAHAAKWDGGGSSPAENCLANVKANIKNDTDMIEIDIQITADGVPVLFHDGSLNSKTDGTGKIQDLTWEQVSKIKYKSDPTQTICSLAQVVKAVKEASSSIILQLDKCDAGELAVISKLGLLSGMGSQVIAKGSASSAPGIVGSMGIGWMQILPTGNVGQVMTSEAADVLAKKIDSRFFEYQFSDRDSYITNGYLSKALNDKGIKTMVVAVGGTDKTNGSSYRGDSSTAWKKIVKDINPNIIMTNRPSQLKALVGN